MPPKKFTMRDLADELGISVSIVSRVLSNQSSKYRISEITEQAVFDAARKHHFRPNRTASGLRLQRTMTLGLIFPDISNPFFAMIIRHIAIKAREGGYSVIICDSEENLAIEQNSAKLLRDYNIDGLIIAPVGNNGAYLREIFAESVPIVVADRIFSDIKLPSVTSENIQGSLEGICHLIQNGHRAIAMLQGTPEASPSRERLQGYRMALRKHRLPYRPSLVTGNQFSEESGYQAAREILQKNERPTAIFASSNQIAFGAIRAISEYGLRIPNDISLITFDDQPYFAHIAPPLTAIAQRTDEIGAKALELLIRKLTFKESGEPEMVKIPTRLVIRKSVSPPPPVDSLYQCVEQAPN